MNEFARGDGSIENPYEIETAHQLNNIRNYLSSHFILANELEFNQEDFEKGGAFYNDGKLWEPIGNIDNPFTGSFYGNSHKIIGLHIDRDNENYIGLFGYIGESAEIFDLGMDDVNISGNQYIGSLVGYNSGSIMGCYVECTLIGMSGILGSLVGYNANRVYDCYALGYVMGDDVIGGLVGENQGNIVRTYSIVTVDGYHNLGGLVGINSGNIDSSFHNGQENYAGVKKLLSEMRDPNLYLDWDIVDLKKASYGGEVWKIGESNYPFLGWQTVPIHTVFFMIEGNLYYSEDAEYRKVFEAPPIPKKKRRFPFIDS